jgi:hypothetical protein
MNPLGTRSRADQLHRALEGGVVRTADADTMRYATVAGRLNGLGADLSIAATPRAEFRAALRTRLVAVAGVQAVTTSEAAPARTRGLESAVSWSQSRRAQRGMGLAAGAMASVVAVAGVAVAGSRSLPGDPFYSVKRGGEALELRTAGSDVAKGSKHLEFAAERLKEVRALTLGRDAAFAGSPSQPLAAGALGGSLSSRVRGALSDMDAETRKGSDLLTGAYHASNNDAPLEILSRFAGQQSRQLTELLPSLPGATRDRAEVSLALVSSVAVQASQLLAVGVCTGQCAPSQAAPSLPPATGGPAPQPAPTANTDAPCGCPPAAVPTRTSDPQPSPQPTEPSSSPAPSPTTKPSPTPTSPAPIPVPVPSALPTPLPTVLPTVLPTIIPTPLPNVPALPGVAGVAGVDVPGLLPRG